MDENGSNPWYITANGENGVPNVEAAAAEDVMSARPRTLAGYNCQDQYYTNRFAIGPPTFWRHDFKLKPSYFTLVGQQPYHGLLNEHPMNHLEWLEDLVSPIKANEVPDAIQGSYWLSFDSRD
ncbi:hypothetical protein F2Q69_00047872 [Brassica cretica]|uniref:Uncharacterized protein n=1 Tax=Brassica cretica TaxID=69181 RepID=A0A8S9PSE2_BRACR|nr:hypothetical protein F2Q69_00047872 [Brassica cretica]